jgi:hypothetical protein
MRASAEVAVAASQVVVDEEAVGVDAAAVEIVEFEEARRMSSAGTTEPVGESDGVAEDSSVCWRSPGDCIQHLVAVAVAVAVVAGLEDNLQMLCLQAERNLIGFVDTQEPDPCPSRRRPRP